MTKLKIECDFVPMITVNLNRLRIDVSQIVLDHQFTIATLDLRHIVDIQESILSCH